MEGAARSLVIVEDEEATRTLLAGVFQSGGYRVVSTGDPTSARDLVGKTRPDLVILDIMMPVMNGYEVLSALQADPETSKVPVVFLTAHSEPAHRNQAFRFGVVDYIVKPINRRSLLERIDELLKALPKRSGVRAVDGAQAPAFIDELKREGRSGVLTTAGERALLKEGRVVSETGPISTAKGAEFRELDPSLEEIAVHDPSSLPLEEGAYPDFSILPELFRTVLIVDDNALFRRFLREVLTRNGFVVYEAATGDEGLRVALSKRPWLILTDLSMPGLDGFELCQSIRSHSLIRHTPVIFLSGWDEFRYRERGLEAGADEYFSKLTPLRELLIRILLVLKRYSEMGTSRKGPRMEGRIEVVGVTGLLQMCHLSSVTGTCVVRSDTLAAEIRFRKGEMVGAESKGASGVDVVYEVLSWSEGSFEVWPVHEVDGEILGASFEAVILEGCRLLDSRTRELS